MRILVTGSNGLLGTKVLDRLLAQGADQPLAASRNERANGYLGDLPFWRVDVADAADVERVLDEARPDAVIHTAALTDVDGCERQRDLARAINSDGAGIVARACAARGIRLVHLSTEYVFDGEAGPYRETDPVSPLGWYAKTKEAGEQAVIAAGGNWSIARTTIIFGYAPHVRANFVLWLVGPATRRQAGADRPRSDRVADAGREPGRDGAGPRRPAMSAASSTRSGADVISRLDFSRQIAATFGLDASLIDPITTAEFGQAAPAPAEGRPADGQVPRTRSRTCRCCLSPRA